MRLNNKTKRIHKALFFLLLVMPLFISCGSQTNENISAKDTSINATTAEAAPQHDMENSDDSVSMDGATKKPFHLLNQAFQKTKGHLLVIFEMLVAVILILSVLLFIAEHSAQPKVYKHYPTSLLWTFVKCIQDPGEMAPPKPITIFGRVIANMIGLVGIALFAIPAGVISSGLISAMDDEKHDALIQKNIIELHNAFERKKDRPTGFQIAPAYVSVVEIQARLGLKEEEILDAVSHDNHYRLINLSTTQTKEEHPQDKLAVEHFPLNTVYGQCIDRGSKVTIVTLGNIVDPIMGWWNYYLAKIGGFNYVSREIGQARPYKSFYTYKPEENIPGNKEFMEDINRLANSDNSWIITLMPASGAMEPSYPTQFHFGYGSTKGDTTYNDSNIMLNDTILFESFYRDFSDVLQEKYELRTDKQLYYDNSNPSYFARHLNHHPNAVVIRVAWSVTCWDTRTILIAQELAKSINIKILGLSDNPDVPELKDKDIGYRGYTD